MGRAVFIFFLVMLLLLFALTVLTEIDLVNMGACPEGGNYAGSYYSLL